MIVVIAAVAAAIAFVVLTRRYWRAPDAGGYNTWLTLAAIVLVLGLGVLAVTGRLHWLAAVAAAVAPFLRRAFGLVRMLPYLGSLFGRPAGAQNEGPRGRSGGPRGRSGGPRGRSGGSMSRADALDILGLDPQPSRDEILAAHRRLIQKLHPDRGGTTYLAAQLNAAKERLLADL
jgi:DnaJ homolog subfamily C member 19